VAKVLGDNAWFIAMDVADEKQVPGCRRGARAVRSSGCVGVQRGGGRSAQHHLESLDLAYWNRVLAVNLSGPMLLAKHCAPYLRAHGGAIVNLASTRAAAVGAGYRGLCGEQGRAVG
jgi:NAD(P)-dependent dehydrogenase (short-subunit alcohol dehydrogenase family)